MAQVCVSWRDLCGEDDAVCEKIDFDPFVKGLARLNAKKYTAVMRNFPLKSGKISSIFCFPHRFYLQDGG